MTAIDTANSYQADFERLDEARIGEPTWLRALRRDAFDLFAALGFPNTRQEEWRFTNVAPIAERRFSLAPAKPLDKAALGPYSFASAGLDELVVVNGHLAPELSSLSNALGGVKVLGLADVATGPLSRHLSRLAAADRQPFAALNTAFMTDGAMVEVPANVVVDRPLHVLFVSVGQEGGAQVSHPRLLVVAGRNSQLRLVESYVTVPGGPGLTPGELPPTGGIFTNAVAQLSLDDGAVVEHYRVQREAPTAYHVATTQARLAHSSVYTACMFTFGGALVRHDTNVEMADEGGDCTLNGLYLADGARLVDNHTFLDHAKPHCSSHETFKGILAGRARAVFNGKILVRPDAQKTDAKQTNKTLLLSDDAQINTKPQLEIYANDVKCTHGATVGQLSEDALFYLQTRGIGRQEAQQMLVRAFAADITSRVRIDVVRGTLDQLLLAAMEGR